MSFPTVVRAGLEELRALDPSRRLFGAGTHRYELHPPLAHEEVTAIEEAWGFRVPEDYRLFLTELGNGGAGPAYGVFRFGETDSGFGHAPWDRRYLRPDRPFPHTVAWNDVSLLEEGSPSPDDFEDDDEYYEALEEWRASDAAHEAQNRYWDAVGFSTGCVPICHHGCALRDYLVVTGSEAGHVWHDASADLLGIHPITKGERRRARFSEWYLDWLEEALAKARSGALR